ncbi:MAG: hypothetical protein R3B72_26210 [Polyangiaceae bacterium]
MAARARRRGLVALASVLAGLALSTLLGGCGKSTEQAEAARVLADVDRMRDAPREARKPLIAAVEAHHPSLPAAADAARICARAYRNLDEAHDALDAAEAALAPSAAPPTDPAALLQRVSEAEGKLVGAQAEILECRHHVAVLRNQLR